MEGGSAIRSLSSLLLSGNAGVAPGDLEGRRGGDATLVKETFLGMRLEQPRWEQDPHR